MFPMLWFPLLFLHQPHVQLLLLSLIIVLVIPCFEVELKKSQPS